MRYLKNIPALFRLEDYTEALTKIMGSLPEDKSHYSFADIPGYDRRLIYKLIARYIPLQSAEISHLLTSFIYEEKNGHVTISERGELEVESVTAALQNRAEDLLHLARYIESAAIAFAILFCIEADMCNVYDEGITYQNIIEHTFDFLIILSSKDYNIETSTILISMGIEFFNARRKETCFYDNKWKEAIIALNHF